MASFRELAERLGALVQDKNIAYGDSASSAAKILAILYPGGVPVDQYADMLLVVRVLDKLSRIAHDRDAFNEDPWQDIAGYGLLGVASRQEGRKDE